MSFVKLYYCFSNAISSRENVPRWCVGVLGEGLAVYPMQQVVFLDPAKQSKAPEQLQNGACGEIFFHTYTYSYCFQVQEWPFSLKVLRNVTDRKTSIWAFTMTRQLDRLICWSCDTTESSRTVAKWTLWWACFVRLVMCFGTSMLVCQPLNFLINWVLL